MDASSWKDQILAIGVVDLVAIAVLLVFFIRGLVKGFVWQVAGIVAIVGGLIAARSLSDALAPKLRSVFPGLTEESGLDLITSYFVIFVAVALAVTLIARLLKGLIDELKLSSFDRLLGGVFGVAKAGALIVVAVSFLTLVTPESWQERIASARTGQWSDLAIQKSGPFFPDEVKAKVRYTMDQIEDTFGSDQGTAQES